MSDGNDKRVMKRLLCLMIDALLSWEGSRGGDEGRRKQGSVYGVYMCVYLYFSESMKCIDT